MKTRSSKCYFCRNKIEKIDHKMVDILKNFLSPTGRILNRRTTGTCSKHQRQLSRAIKRARELALLPYVVD